MLLLMLVSRCRAAGLQAGGAEMEGESIALTQGAQCIALVQLVPSGPLQGRGGPHSSAWFWRVPGITAKSA